MGWPREEEEAGYVTGLREVAAAHGHQDDQCGPEGAKRRHWLFQGFQK